MSCCNRYTEKERDAIKNLTKVGTSNTGSHKKSTEGQKITCLSIETIAKEYITIMTIL